MSKNKNSDLTGQTSFFEHLDRNVERKESPSKRNDRGERDLPQTRQHDEERKMSRMPIQLTLKSIAQGLPARLRAHKPEKADVVAFANHFITYMSSITANATEENLKVHLMDLLKKRYHPQNTVEPQGSIDFVIRQGGVGTPAAVLFESKRSSNASDMIRPDNINRKALHELVLYYMQERDAGNTSIKYLVVSTEFELFIFEASFFERTFYKNTGFKSDFRA